MFWKLALTRPAASVPDERSVSLSCAQPVCSAPAAFAWPGEKPAGDCPLSFAESLKLALVLKALLVEGPVPLSATCPVTVVVAVVVSLTSAVEETPPGRYGLGHCTRSPLAVVERSHFSTPFSTIRAAASTFRTDDLFARRPPPTPDSDPTSPPFEFFDHTSFSCPPLSFPKEFRKHLSHPRVVFLFIPGRLLKHGRVGADAGDDRVVSFKELGFVDLKLIESLAYAL